MSVRFITLGPTGTCHEYALLRYLEFQGLEDTQVHFCDDFLVGLERLRAGEVDFLVQNSAHPTVFAVTEKYHHEVFVVDTFICQTKPMGLLARVGVEQPRTVGLMPATRGYFDVEQFQSATYETANPLVGRGLLEGRYDAGFTFLEYAEQHPERLRVVKTVGTVDTGWLVYGRKPRALGRVVGLKDPTLFAR